MRKRTFLKMSVAGSIFSLLLLDLDACSSNNGTNSTGASSNTQPKADPTATTASTNMQRAPSATAVSSNTQPTATAIPTANNTGFAATVGGSEAVNRSARGDNLTTIHSAVDRPVAKITETTLNVPPRAKGVVYIQNDSANPQTLVSDTANGFPTFTIAPYTTTLLVFHRTGTFKAHLQGYPISADTTLTIIITAPSPD
jgi:hypothetical protein